MSIPARGPAPGAGIGKTWHYPNARCGTSKRGPKIRFGAPVEQQDPTVDLVVALTRQDASGLWIPNLEKDTWEASDPEAHAALFNGGPIALRRTRRQIIRLAKAWNRQFSEPAFCSFHLSALALESVQGGLGLPEALGMFFADAAGSLRWGNTADPAGVTPPIKLRLSREVAIGRLEKAGDAVSRALENDDDFATVRASLATVFWEYIEDAEVAALATAISTLRPRTAVTTTSLGLAGAAALSSLPELTVPGGGDTLQRVAVSGLVCLPGRTVAVPCRVAWLRRSGHADPDQPRGPTPPRRVPGRVRPRCVRCASSACAHRVRRPGHGTVGLR
jgi:hypothetical protein